MHNQKEQKHGCQGPEDPLKRCTDASNKAMKLKEQKHGNQSAKRPNDHLKRCTDASNKAIKELKEQKHGYQIA